MGKAGILGELEQLILLAILRLDGETYAVPILEEPAEGAGEGRMEGGLVLGEPLGDGAEGGVRRERVVGGEHHDVGVSLA